MELLFGFAGRIGRTQWWLGQLAICAVWTVLSLVFDIFVGVPMIPVEYTPGELPEFGLSALLACVTGLVLAGWINLATTIKRFHDRDKSGYWVLILLAPVFGQLWVLIECGLLAGSRGINVHGWPYGRQSRLQTELAAYAARAHDQRTTEHDLGHVQRPSYRTPTMPSQQARLAAQSYQARITVPANQSRPAAPATFGRRGTGQLR